MRGLTREGGLGEDAVEAMMGDEIELRSPRNEREWERYFALRWEMLRRPWNQAKGSERDGDEDGAWHLAAFDAQGAVVGVGRLQRGEGVRGRVRFMAVAADWRGKGLGKRLLEGLERLAVEGGLEAVELNAREPVIGFYERLGYRVTGAGPTLFGEVRHRVMEKRLHD